MRSWVLLCGLVAGAITTHAQFEEPHLGLIRTTAGEVRTVRGIAGAFILGHAAARRAISVACSGPWTAAKFDDAVEFGLAAGDVLIRATAPDGPAVFGFSSKGKPELVWFRTTRELHEVVGGGLRRVAFDALEADEEVVSVTVLGARRVFLTRRGEELTLLTTVPSQEGSREFVRKRLAVTDGPALLSADGSMILARERTLELRRPGSRVPQRFDAPERPSELAAMGNGWIAVRFEGGAMGALTVTPGHEQLYRLPETAE
jgi:hypothetical protein